MSKTNIQLVREYIEEVPNKKHFDRIFEYCSKDCVIHIAPYVGLGLNADDRSGERIILLDIAPTGPAHGKLLPGDELIRVQDDDKIWETFDELKSGMWGMGVFGTRLTVTVRRDGKLLSIPLVRSRVEGWDLKLHEIVDVWWDDIKKHWPDIRSEIKLIFGQDDLVSCFSIVSGTNLEYQRTAVWSECNIYRIQNGKIIETWGVEDSYSEMKQLGFRISEPVKELA
jgi:predicted SnoaL-like aldol condensation-catalyzing enzyme